MTRTKYILSLIIATWSIMGSAAQVKGLLARTDSSYSCVNMKEAGLRTFKEGRVALVPFFRKLDNIINRQRGTINIWHVGGSHVQAGTFSHRLRRDFSTHVNSNKGSRAIMFPYKLVGTNGPHDYSVSGTGSWSRTRNIEQSPDREMGMSGITATTSSPNASVTFTLSASDGIDWSTRYIRVLGKASSSSVRPYIMIDSTAIEDTEGNNDTGYFFELPRSCTSFTVKFHGLGSGNRFELRGVVALNDEPGVTYWESGVNGAATTSWLRCSLLEKDRIKRVNPNCQFIFITNNDNHLNRSANPNSRSAEKVFIELALDNNGSVWDLYKVMGGLGSSTRWVRSGLMQSDHVHFTSSGYKLIGDLLYNAIIGEYLKWRERNYNAETY